VAQNPSTIYLPAHSPAVSTSAATYFRRMRSNDPFHIGSVNASRGSVVSIWFPFWFPSGFHFGFHLVSIYMEHPKTWVYGE